MTSISRRGFVIGAAATSLVLGLKGTGARAGQGPLMLYDPSLDAGRRFAAQAGRMDHPVVALSGDRVRQTRALLADTPAALYGVTRHSDQLLVSEVAREAGYRSIAIVQHRIDGSVVPQCRAEAGAIGTLARRAGSRWPEAFAELAVGGVERCSAVEGRGPVEPALSWVLVRAG